MGVPLGAVERDDLSTERRRCGSMTCDLPSGVQLHTIERRRPGLPAEAALEMCSWFEGLMGTEWSEMFSPIAFVRTPVPMRR